MFADIINATVQPFINAIIEALDEYNRNEYSVRYEESAGQWYFIRKWRANEEEWVYIAIATNGTVVSAREFRSVSPKAMRAIADFCLHLETIYNAVGAISQRKQDEWEMQMMGESCPRIVEPWMFTERED